MPRADYDNPPGNLVHLGLALKSLRKERDLKQIELATAAGTSEAQISDIERAQNNPGWLLITRLLTSMDATVSDLANAYTRAQRGELD